MITENDERIERAQGAAEREARGAGHEERARQLEGLVGRAATLLEAKSDAAARRAWAGHLRQDLQRVLQGKPIGTPDGDPGLERIARAATAFVDEQGKANMVDLLKDRDFAVEEFEGLKLALEAAGR